VGLLSPILRDGAGNLLTWWCPGCNSAHQVRAVVRQAAVIEPDPDNPDWTPPREYYEARDGAWTWNGSATKPTFQPSVLVKGSEFTDAGRAAYESWFAAGCPQPSPLRFESRDTCCHSFVVDGRMQFLSDCTHSLAGQTVLIPDWPTGGV